MGNRVEGKVCLITGASSGMGAQAARRFAEEGAKVVVGARREDKGQGVVQEIRDAGGEALFVRTDVLELDDIENLVKTTVGTYGRIDVALGNAGTGNFFDIHMMDIEHDFDWTMKLFCRANWYLSKMVLPYMMEQKKAISSSRFRRRLLKVCLAGAFIRVRRRRCVTCPRRLPWVTASTISARIAYCPV